MKHRLRRIFVSLLHVLSFVWLGVACVTVFLWWRSYWFTDRIEFPGTQVYAASEETDDHACRYRVVLESGQGEWAFMAGRYRYMDWGSAILPDDELTVSSQYVGANDEYRPVIIDDPYPDAIDPTAGTHIQFLGFTYFHEDQVVNTGSTVIGPFEMIMEPWGYEHIILVPYWFVTLIVGIWPTVWLCCLLRSYRRLKRRARGHCGRCNYNLRGNVNVENCPECGATPLFASIQS